MTDSQEPDEQNTWAGCLLLLATVLVAFPVGVIISMWTAPPLLDLLGENSPDFVKLAVGIVLYSPTVLTGLAFYFTVGALLRLVGIRLTRPRPTQKGSRGDPSASELTLGKLTLNQKPDQLFVQESDSEHAMGLIMSPLCGTLFAILLAVAIWDPGGAGKGLLAKCGFVKLDPQGWLFVALAWIVASIVIAFFGIMTFLCFYDFYRKLRRGQESWSFDRSQGVLTRGNERVRSLASITHVVLSHDHQHCVAFAPEMAPSASEGGEPEPGENVFAFANESDAEKFAAIIACFLGVKVQSGM
jgi:hypothetical protein